MATATKSKPTAIKTDEALSKPKVKNVTTRPLAEFEAEMIGELVTDPKVEPEKITKPMLVKRFRRLVREVDEGKLRFYTQARSGSASGNDWISPAVVKRVRAAVAKERPGAAN